MTFHWFISTKFVSMVMYIVIAHWNPICLLTFNGMQVNFGFCFFFSSGLFPQYQIEKISVQPSLHIWFYHNHEIFYICMHAWWHTLFTNPLFINLVQRNWKYAWHYKQCIHAKYLNSKIGIPRNIFFFFFLHLSLSSFVFFLFVVTFLAFIMYTYYVCALLFLLL